MLTSFGLELSMVENKFRGLVDDLEIWLFSRETDWPPYREIKRLLEKLATITDKIKPELVNYDADKEKVERYGIKRVPALAIIGRKDYGIRYYCIPEGAELYNFLDDLVQISSGQADVSPETEAKLAQIKRPVQLEYFVSPNCPFAWPGERNLLKLAMANDLINLDIINVTDFREVAEKYGVRGIPVTVVNGKGKFYGALPEHEFVDAILANLK